MWCFGGHFSGAGKYARVWDLFFVVAEEGIPQGLSLSPSVFVESPRLKPWVT
jgi:hypothetical protein